MSTSINAQFFCSMPFRYIEVTGWNPPKGDVFICCPNWLPTPVGNIRNDSFENIWNSNKAIEIRRSILDGSFGYCNHTTCPHLQTKTEAIQKTADIQDKDLLEIIENKLTILPYGPREVRCSYDKSCNLSCPSCRTEVIIEKAYEQEILEIQAKLENEALKDAHRLSITGSGDPFGSPYNRRWLQTMRKEAMPHLKVIHIHTNGQLWIPQLWSTIPADIRNAIKTTEISIDAASPTTYSLNRRGGSFQRLLKNLEFISQLRKNSDLTSVNISMVVQKNNFKEMPDFVHLGSRFGFDKVTFSRLMNWETFSEEEYISRAIHLSSHPNHKELIELLGDKVLHEPIVYLGNLTDIIQQG